MNIKKNQFNLSEADKKTLIQFARKSIESMVRNGSIPEIDLEMQSSALQNPGTSFITLTKNGDLRGCIGGLEPKHALIQDVIEHAAAAAVDDYRFPPVTSEELDQIKIEISILTPPIRLPYDTPEELVSLLRPGIDGVTLHYGMHRATFLPQVWEKLPDANQFLSHLCNKMGLNWDFWLKNDLQVSVYQVIHFQEE
jgi:AmmeMemoRadiSam system protein A